MEELRNSESFTSNVRDHLVFIITSKVKVAYQFEIKNINPIRYVYDRKNMNVTPSLKS